MTGNATDAWQDPLGSLPLAQTPRRGKGNA
jgi:hypothetical protein